MRSEMARRKLKRADVCDRIGMNPNALTLYLNELRPLTAWAAHNIGYGINAACGLFVMHVDMSIGVLPRKDTLRHAQHKRVSLVKRRGLRREPIPPVPKRKHHRTERKK